MSRTYPDHSTLACPMCSKDKLVITDPESGEIISSTCGIVISDKIEESQQARMECLQ